MTCRLMMFLLVAVTSCSEQGETTRSAEAKKTAVASNESDSLPSPLVIKTVKADITGTLRKHVRDFRLCYRKNAQESKPIGRVILKWTVTKSGDAVDVSAVDIGGASEKLVTCLMTTVESTKFMPQTEDTEVRFPFSFASFGTRHP